MVNWLALRLELSHLCPIGELNGFYKGIDCRLECKMAVTPVSNKGGSPFGQLVGYHNRRRCL
jgi:hypothetical protein